MSSVINIEKNHKNFFFDNTEISFRNKSDKELHKSYWLFKIISSNFLTSIGPPIINFAFRTGLPVKGIIRKTIFSHFCGGESIEDCIPSIEKLAVENIGTILDYSVEGDSSENAFDATCKEILQTIEMAGNNRNIPFSVFKPSGLGRFSLFEKLNSKKPLSDTESEEFKRVRSRINTICKAAYQKNVKILIDAEHSWIQNSIDELALENMQLYNRKKAVIFNTYQLYCHEKLASLISDFHQAEAEGYFLGVKLVRGAYMEIERSRAEKKNYRSPIHKSKADTDRDYNDGLHFCLDHLDKISLVAGTHNEQSCQLLVTEMQKRKISPSHPNISFAQLYGMSDNLSFNLAYNGYNVAKYVPYGNIAEVMPYLFRRAQENTSVAGQTGRELSLIIKETKRRKKAKMIQNQVK